MNKVFSYCFIPLQSVTSDRFNLNYIARESGNQKLAKYTINPIDEDDELELPPIMILQLKLEGEDGD